MPAGTGETGTSRISSVLELRKPQRLFRYSHFYEEGALSAAYGIGIEEHDKEGRVITLEFEEYYFVTVYTPNSQSELRRLEYRMKWEEDFLAYLLKLQEKKPVICCGDLNVAHQRSISRIRRPTAKMQALLMKREPAYQSSRERLY